MGYFITKTYKITPYFKAVVLLKPNLQLDFLITQKKHSFLTHYSASRYIHILGPNFGSGYIAKHVLTAQFSLYFYDLQNKISHDKGSLRLFKIMLIKVHDE